MPVDERAVRILFPGPNVQCVKRLQSESVGGLKVVKKLSHQVWRPWFMRLVVIPLLRIHQKIRAGQLQTSVCSRFIENDLRLGWINHATAHQIHIDEMEAHRSLVGSAHAAKTKGISFSFSLYDIVEPIGRFPNHLD